MDEKVYDLIILDIMLPGEDGLRLCRKLRDSSQKCPDIPIIFTSALGESADRIVGLEIGADDYLPKPFAMRELIARIRAVLRRSSKYAGANQHNQVICDFVHEKNSQSIRFAKWKLDLFSRCIIDDNEIAVALSKTEFMLLSFLLHNPGKVLSREQIIAGIGNDDVYDRNVDVQINRLRNKLRDTDKNHPIIKTVRGMGYMLAVCDETGSRELRQAANTLNAMRQRIYDNIEQRNQMLAALAHDLRTPLARMILRAERLEDPMLGGAFLKDCGEIEALANQGLELARSLHSDEKPVMLDLCSFIESIIDDYRDAGFGIAYARPTEEAPYLLTRPGCLRRCLGNLLDNAMRYAGNAQISILVDPDHIVVDVTDTGPGIPACEFQNALKPFHQLEKSRNKKFGGAGLGLSIACNMARLGFASLSLHPNIPTGLRVRLAFSRN